MSGGGLLLYVGGYTTDERPEGLHLVRVDLASGAMRLERSCAAGPNPSYLATRPERQVLYAVNEVEDFGGERAGAVAACALDDPEGAPVLRERRSSRGAAPCHLSLDRTGRFVLVANYAGGSVAVLPVSDDGALGDACDVVRHAGRGPHPERQEGPHAHCVVVDPDNRFALVADLGVDRVMVYRFDDARGTLAPAATPSAATAPGAGPRRVVFHPDGRTVYVVNELAVTIGAYRWDARAGTLEHAATVEIPRARVAEGDTGAHAQVAPSGRFLYASVRGDDGLTVFALDDPTRPRAVQRVSSGGRWPRAFALDPSGTLLVAGNQRSDALASFRVNLETGLLAPTGHELSVPSPTYLLFAAR